MIDTKNRFSGKPTIMHEMAAAGLRPPVFDNRRGVFKVALSNESIRKTFIEGTPIDAENLAARILAYCSEPRSREELATYLQIKSSHYAISRYVKPLVDGG